MAQTLNLNTLAADNRFFAGTGGVSHENYYYGFVPGFLDRETGMIYPSRRANGALAPFHALDGLPEHLVLARDPVGQVVAIKTSVIAGFVRRGCFYTREQAACCCE